MLDKHPRLQTLVAVLLAIPVAWAIWIAILLALALYTGTVHAQEPAPTGQGVRIDCTEHRTILGLHWGWDCTATGGPDTTTLQLTEPEPSKFWCSHELRECKGSGKAQLRINDSALAAFDHAQRLRLSLDCALRPHEPTAECAIATVATGEQP